MNLKAKIKKIILDGRLIGAVAIIIAIIFIALSVVNLTSTLSKDSGTDTIKAVVVETYIENEVDIDGVETTMYYPVIEYTDKNGETIRARSESGKKFNEYRKGDELKVLVNPDNPNSFDIVPVRKKYVLPVFLIFIGAGIGAVGVWSIKEYIQNKKEGIYSDDENKSDKK